MRLADLRHATQSVASSVFTLSASRKGDNSVHSAKMRILFLSIAKPDDFSSGGNQRSNHMRNALLRIGQIDTITITQENRPSTQRDWDNDRCAEVNIGQQAKLWKKLRYRLIAYRMINAAEKRRNYDYIVARYFRTAVLVPWRMHYKLIIDADDLRQAVAGQPIARRLFVRLRSSLIRLIAKRVFHIWLVDPRDRVTVPGASTSMLPNTAQSFAPSIVASQQARTSSRKRILMVGTYAYPPNEEGLTWFATAILPRILELMPDVELHAVGPYYKPHLNELGTKVVMRGFVEDLAAEYRQADVVICPIRSGSGTQIKVVEALLSGRPLVASEFSFQGFSDVLEADSDLLVASTQEQWVEHVASVLVSPERFTEVAAAGRIKAEAAYSVQAFSERVVATLT